MGNSFPADNTAASFNCLRRQGRGSQTIITKELALNLRLNQVGIAVFVAAVAIGCGSEDGNLPKTVPVSGLVTLDGVPVDGAQVIFVPDGSGTGAYGSTDSAGKFALRISEKKDGAIPGNYKVQVSKTIEKKLPGTLDGGDAVSFEYGLPANYTGHLTSGLTAQIPDSGTDAIKLELTSK